ncbi:MAG: F0F1 ATP synthase subunit B [bacterium]|nr:F0F1 ATP synthase subunit B [bacterium]
MAALWVLFQHILKIVFVDLAFFAQASGTGDNLVAAEATEGPMIGINATLFIQVINFLLLLYLLYRFCYKPFLAFLDTRSKDVEETLVGAEQTRQEANELFQQYKEKMEGSNEEASDIVRNAVNEGDQQKKEIIAAAKAEARTMVEEAKQDILREQRKAIRDLREETINLSLMAASRILDQKLTKEDDKKLVAKFIDELEGLDARKIDS